MGKRHILYVGNHKVVIYWEDWMNGYRAYSETLGEEDSPYADGRTITEAYKELEWQLQELDEKKAQKHERTHAQNEP